MPTELLQEKIAAAIASFNKGAHDQAETFSRQALAFKEPSDLADRWAAEAFGNLGMAFMSVAKFSTAQLCLERCINVLEGDKNIHPSTLAQLISNRASCFLAENKFAEALPLCEKAWGVAELAGKSSDEQRPVFLSNLASAYYKLDRLREAECYYKLAIEAAENIWGDHELVAVTQNNLANCCRDQDKYDVAIELYNLSIAYFTDNGGASPDLAFALNSYADCLRKMGNEQELVKVIAKLAEVEEELELLAD